MCDLNPSPAITPYFNVDLTRQKNLINMASILQIAFKYILCMNMCEYVWISIKMSLKFDPQSTMHELIYSPKRT